MKNSICAITHKPVNKNECYFGRDVRLPVFTMIQSDHPEFKEDSIISTEALTVYRRKYLEELVKREIGEVNRLENDVIESISQNQILSENVEDNIEEHLTAGQKIADKIADFGGSWSFILIFFLFLILWMFLNTYLLFTKIFDPYPFILLNLILSCLAAIQAPVIMMSQNRKETKDRKRSEHDYKVNLKAELEIRLLHEKIEHLITSQNKHLIEIQELQTDYLDDILKEVRNNKGKTK